MVKLGRSISQMGSKSGSATTQEEREGPFSPTKVPRIESQICLMSVMFCSVDFFLLLMIFAGENLVLVIGL